jgi:hypothetical protein
MSLSEAKAEQRGINTSNFKAADWKVLTDQGSGAITLDVTLNPDTGEFIYRPE